jgi:predicted MFS family arabinose efflux permease
MNQGYNTVSARVSDGDISTYLWLLFAVCFLGNVLGGMASTLMSVYLPVVVKELLGTADGGDINRVSAYISALYFAGWTVGGFTWGVIGDRIGRARSLAMALVMFGIFTFLTSFVTSWEMAMIFRFLCGFGVGGMLVINTTLLSEVWPDRSRAIFIGILSVGFPVGIFSSGAVNFLVSSWRHGFTMGILPLGIGAVSLGLLRESEKWQKSRHHAEGSVTIDRSLFRRDLLNGSVIFGSMLIGLWAIFSWVPTWVQSLLKGTDGQHERGLSMMLMGAGGLTGGFLSGWVSNALGTRKAMLVCFSGCFILSFLLFKINTGFSGITAAEITLLSFLFGISQGLLSVYIPLLFPVPLRATATGFCFNTGRIFTAAAVFFVGALVTNLGGYGNSLFVFSFILLLGFIFLLFSKNITH